MNSEINKFKDILTRNRGNVFVVDPHTGEEFTYGDIERFSLQLAGMLSRSGIKKSYKVAIFLPNCVEFIIIYFACMHLGAIAVPVNHKLHPKEAEYMLSNTGAEFLFTSSSLAEAMNGAGISVKHMFSFTPCNEKGGKSREDTDGFFSWIRQQEAYVNGVFSGIEDTDTFVIVHTSGTTRRPKGVMISYGNIIRHSFTFSKTLAFRRGSRFYTILDLAYLGGFHNLMLIPFACQGSIVLDKTFSPRMAVVFWPNVAKYKIDTLWLVPSFLSLLLSLDRSDMKVKHSVEKALVGTAPLALSLKERFEKKYSVTLYENYGLSETFFLSTNAPAFPFNKGVGKPIEGCSVAIVNEEGRMCGAGERGEIAVKTDYIMKGYYEDPEETKMRFKDGMFYTGDIGHLDEEGHLFVSDRKKDMIIKGGINISPKEVEEAVMMHPEVSEAVVVGFPNEYSGEEIVAVVNVNRGSSLKENDIKLHLRGHLASFKIPERIYLNMEVPRSVTGKVQKNKLKDILNRESKGHKGQV